MPPVGFEPTISAGERPQTYALLYLYLYLLFYDHKEGHRKIECNIKLTSTDRLRACLEAIASSPDTAVLEHTT
jgi:hypothetical protein